MLQNYNRMLLSCSTLTPAMISSFEEHGFSQHDEHCIAGRVAVPPEARAALVRAARSATSLEQLNCDVLQLFDQCPPNRAFPRMSMVRHVAEKKTTSAAERRKW